MLRFGPIGELAAFLLLAGAPALLSAQSSSRLADVPNPQAIAQVAGGQKSLANAAWWGFNREDSTEALQAAINSGAKHLVIPFMGEPWIVRPLQLRSDQEILFEPGVLVLAKKAEFQGPGDSLFTAVGQSNLVLRGYGATLRMRK